MPPDSFTATEGIAVQCLRRANTWTVFRQPGGDHVAESFKNGYKHRLERCRRGLRTSDRVVPSAILVPSAGIETELMEGLAGIRSASLDPS